MTVDVGERRKGRGRPEYTGRIFIKILDETFCTEDNPKIKLYFKFTWLGPVRLVNYLDNPLFITPLSVRLR